MFHEAKAIDVVGHAHGRGFTCFPFAHFYIFLFISSNLHRKKILHSINIMIELRVIFLCWLLYRMDNLINTNPPEIIDREEILYELTVE